MSKNKNEMYHWTSNDTMKNQVSLQMKEYEILIIKKTYLDII